MRPLRFRYLWLFGGLCLVTLVLYSTLMPPRPEAYLLNDKMAHGVAFMALMIWFCGVFEMRFSPLIAVALASLGVAIELVQEQLTYRAAEIADGVADLTGIGVGWALAIVGLQYWASLLESWVATDRS